MQQDELTRLFSANMNLSQSTALPTYQQALQDSPVQQVHDQEQEQEHAPKQIVYASQHYTHSHHVAPRSASEPPMKTHIDPSHLGDVLLRNSIDPSLLFPSQIELFQNADDDQRLRLLELWRISPPTGRQGYPSGTDYNMSRQLYDWPPTSLAQEEAMAKLRYEKQQADAAQQKAIQQHQQQLEQSMNAASAEPEPYMASGYEMMARREYEESARAENALKESNKYNQATDPVYNNTGNHGLWQKNVGSISDMENNYGAYAYAREYGLQAGYGDEEMVM
jgi:exonuclease VII large subunit